jgi:hypothetical protein
MGDEKLGLVVAQLGPIEVARSGQGFETDRLLLASCTACGGFLAGFGTAAALVVELLVACNVTEAGEGLGHNRETALSVVCRMGAATVGKMLRKAVGHSRIREGWVADDISVGGRSEDAQGDKGGVCFCELEGETVPGEELGPEFFFFCKELTEPLEELAVFHLAMTWFRLLLLLLARVIGLDGTVERG